MGKMNIKELMAQTREITRHPYKHTDIDGTLKQVTMLATDSEHTDIIIIPEESDIDVEMPVQKQKFVREKKQPTVKPPVQTYLDSPLINTIREYDPGTETQRITYIINEANYRILSAIKAESKTSIMCLINFFLDEALKGRSVEINKLIHKQFKNLKL